MTKTKRFAIKEKRPQVLVLGNGLSHSVDWKEVIRSLARDGAADLMDTIPYALQATLTCPTEDVVRRKMYEEFFKEKYSYSESSEVYEELLRLPFDAILTTNYTYEPENCLKEGYSALDNQSKKSFALRTTAKEEYGAMLHTFNRLEKNGVSQDIWHIHGEARRKSSIVLTYDEYARLISKILDYNKENGNRYQTESEEEADGVEFRSWVDYFILGDLYVLGLGLDFSEMDLWWLFNRRERERTGKGKTVFLSPWENKTERSQAMDALGFLRESLSFEVALEMDDDTKNAQYDAFYREAAKHLKCKFGTQ